MKRTICIILILAALFMMFSCGDKDKTASEKAEQTPEKTEYKEERLPDEVVPETVVFSDYASIAVVKPSECSSEVMDAASKADTAVRNAVSASPVFCSDTKTNDENTLEILIGNTSRDESYAVAYGLRTDDYYVGTNKNKIIVVGGSDEMTALAVEQFSLIFADVYARGKFTPDDFIIHTGDYAVRSAEISGVRLDRFTIVYPQGEDDTQFEAERLQKLFAEKYRYELAITDDSEPEAKYEILVGCTSRSASKALKDAPLAEYCYNISASENKLVFAAGSLWAYGEAFDKLNSFISGDGAFSVPQGTDVKVTNASVKKTTHDFVYITTKGRDGDIPVKKLTLCGADISEYVIVYHDYGEGYTGFGENEMFAAKELQTYIEYATGITLPLVADTENPTEREIIVGTTARESDGTVAVDRTDFGTEALYYATDASRLIIAGGEERGTLYSVYAFLEEQLGCRFFSSDCEIICNAESIDVPSGLNVFEKSDLEYRDNSTFSTLSARTAPKMKMNSEFRRQLDAAHGGCITFLNGNDGFTHTMSRYLGLGSDKTQPCLSSEKTYEKALAAVRQYLEINPNADIVSITQNDNDDKCSCANCAAINREEGSDAGTLIRFVNRIAEELAGEYPNVKFLTLAYMYSSDPTKTAPAPNVIVELCNFEDCLACPAGECADNSVFLDRIKGWSALTDNLYIWYYGCAFWPGKVDTPFMNTGTMYDEMKIYRENGVKGVFVEGRTEVFGHEFGELRAYLFSKLMWDPDLTKEEYDTALHEFIAAYYGPVSDMVQKYYDFLCEASEGNHYDLWAGPETVFDVSLFAANAREISNWWATAFAVDGANSDTQRHIDALYEGFKYVNDCISAE